MSATIHFRLLITSCCARYDEAFSKVLELANADMVAWLCGQVDVTILRRQPPLLSQGVLLALIQQLGVDLSRVRTLLVPLQLLLK